jgi:hypothetical protein
VIMGIQYLDNTWLVARPAEETRPAAVVPVERTGSRYYMAAAATLVAALALIAGPGLVASLAIVGIPR